MSAASRHRHAEHFTVDRQVAAPAVYDGSRPLGEAKRNASR